MKSPASSGVFHKEIDKIISYNENMSISFPRLKVRSFLFKLSSASLFTCQRSLKPTSSTSPALRVRGFDEAVIKVSAIFIFSLFALVTPVITFARTTPNDIYQQTRSNFEASIAKISDSAKRESVIQADQILKDINLAVCTRFQVDVDKLSAILEEEKTRQGVTQTVVAYGQGNTPLDTAAYFVNYAAEALAYQKSQDYTPNISSGNFASALTNSSNKLKANLQLVQNKILRAKTEVKKALDYYEK